jgi:hypothetical protein
MMLNEDHVEVFISSVLFPRHICCSGCLFHPAIAIAMKAEYFTRHLTAEFKNLASVFSWCEEEVTCLAF